MKLKRSLRVTITCLVALSLLGWQTSALASADQRLAASNRGVYDRQGNLISSIPEHGPRGSILSLPVTLLVTAAVLVVGPPLMLMRGIKIPSSEATKVQATAEPPAKAPPAKRRGHRRQT